MTRGAAFIFLLALAGCGRVSAPAAPLPQGSSAAPRVMSMNPCIDAILIRVADPGQILSISHYSHDPASTSIPLDIARRYPANADTAEEVVALRPDMVLLSPHVAQATQRAIRTAGVRIESVGVPATIAESRDQVMQVARAVGHPERGAALLQEIDAALAQARPPAGSRPVGALIRSATGLVPGEGTLAAELLEQTGFHNMSGNYGLAMWDILPVEPLIARPPQLLLTDVAAGHTRNRLLGEVPGLRIADFPNRLLQCAGPNLIDAARQLAAIRRRWGQA